MEPYRITPYILLFGTKTGYFWVCGINWHPSGSQTHEVLLFYHHPPRKTWGRPNTWATVPHVCVFSHYTHSIYLHSFQPIPRASGGIPFLESRSFNFSRTKFQFFFHRFQIVKFSRKYSSVLWTSVFHRKGRWLFP